MTITTHSQEETEHLGQKLAGRLFPGAVVALWGPMGAGKTAFTRGLARGLGVGGRVHSPTFALVHEHSGRLPLYHMDLYRLVPGGLDEDVEEYFAGNGVCAVEWPGRAGDALPRSRLDITFEVADDDTRRMTFLACGAGYESVLEDLQ